MKSRLFFYVNCDIKNLKTQPQKLRLTENENLFKREFQGLICEGQENQMNFMLFLQWL